MELESVMAQGKVLGWVTVKVMQLHQLESAEPAQPE
jgi:hypothetical protein